MVFDELGLLITYESPPEVVVVAEKLAELPYKVAEPLVWYSVGVVITT